MNETQIETTKNIGDIVAKYRDKMTLREFGEALGVSHQTIANWEQGVSQPERGSMAYIFLTCQDWRGDFALEVLEIISPEWRPT